MTPSACSNGPAAALIALALVEMSAPALVFRQAERAEGAVRINRQGEDLHIETLSVAPPDSRIELISANEADWNALQTSLLRLRLS